MILLCDSVQKADPQADALVRILRFLSTWEPQAKKFLVGGKTENQLSYKDIQTALLSKTIPTTLLAQWQQQYALFVADVLSPLWDSACQTAAQQVASSRPGFVFDPYLPAVQKWTETRAAALITQCTVETKKGIQAALKRSVYHENIGVDELSKVIRPMIGLTRPQIVANQNYYNTLLDNGVKQQVAAQRSASYAARQHRYRAQMVARTESATAYNHAEYEVVRQAQKSGYMGKTVKVWCTAGDERTCATCGALNGKQIEFGEDYTVSGGDVRVPPAHPQCRCTLLYEENTEPDLSLDSLPELGENSNSKITQITDDTIENIPLVHIPGFSEKDCIEIQKQHKALLKESKENNKGYEVSYAFSSNFSRLEKSLGSEKDAYANINGLGKNVFVMHNHPRNSSYSTQDLIFLMSNDEVRALTIVTNSGRIEALMKTENYDMGKVETIFRRIFKPILDNQTESAYNKAVAKFITKASKEGLLQWITT